MNYHRSESIHMGTDPVVVALGGNTLLGEHGAGTIEEQLDVIERTARRISGAIDAGYDVVLTHGNGPQVGNLLLQQENTAETPRLPLDVLVAETQAQIGYLLQRALDNEVSVPTDFVTVVTQVVVDADDHLARAASGRANGGCGNADRRVRFAGAHRFGRGLRWVRTTPFLCNRP